MQNLTYQSLRQFLEEKDLKTSSNMIQKLFLRDRDDFRKNLLLSGILPEPLSRNFEQEKHILKAFFSACQIAELSISMDYPEIKQEFHEQFAKTVASIVSIHKNFMSNTERLMQNDFLNFPFAKQVQMWCTFLENQTRLATSIATDTIKAKGYSTGLEQEVSKSDQLSIHSNLEAGFEVFDTLIRFLQFKAKRKLDKGEFVEYTDVSPYNIPSIEEISLLTQLKSTYDTLWEYIKFGKWYFDKDTVHDRPLLYFHASDSTKFKIERAGKIRYHIQQSNRLQQEIYILSKLSDHVEQLFREFEFTLDNPKTLFEIKRESYCLVEELIDNVVALTLSNIKKWLGPKFQTIRLGADSNITISDLQNCSVYLKTMAFIYQSKSHVQLDETHTNNYHILAPVVDLELIICNYSRLYNKQLDIAEAIIKMFVFYPDSDLDIFSQPLLYIGHNKVVFTPCLMDQMNIERIIQQQLILWDIDITKKGFVFEDIVRESLGEQSRLVVNPRSIKFPAYDGQDVEFDILATFGEKIVLIETKCLLRPYTPKEYNGRENDVYYGVEQVNRRAEVVKRQWEELKQNVEIPLPELPPTDKDIIKIVCLNIFDFTGIVEGDVFITDYSSLLVFFSRPVINKYELHSDFIIESNAVTLWEGAPNSEQFLDYLRMPITMKHIYENLEEKPQTLLMINEDDWQIAFEDYYLINDPIESIFTSQVDRKMVNQNIANNKKQKKGNHSREKAKMVKKSRKKNRKK